MTLQLNIFVEDPAALLVGFNVLRLQRSVSGSGGPWEDITANTATPASIISADLPPYFISGQTLRIQHEDDPEIAVTFTGSNPLTPSQVVAQINAEAGFSLATNESGSIRLTSSGTGTDSFIEIVGGSACNELGFTVGQRDVGLDAHITLVLAQQNYTYIDYDGERGYFYRVAAYNTVDDTIGLYSTPFEGTTFTPLPADSLSLAYIDLVAATGAASEGQIVTLYPLQYPNQVSGFGVGLEREKIILKTDVNGHAETTLVRGLTVRVVFDGTSLVREITVPDSASFNLMALVEGAPDPFTVAVPNIPAAPRRTT